MRGSRTFCQLLLDDKGIIPAHAGLTAPCRSLAWAEWDHPRACGAHASCCISQPTRLGSSPRMRGSLLKCLDRWFRNGIIPAHAGLTIRVAASSCASWDHPRACGAHTWSRRVTSHSLGSSPRMRGSRELSCHPTIDFGIIPAHAGLTNTAGIYSVTAWDHPRACGAHFPLPPIES